MALRDYPLLLLVVVAPVLYAVAEIGFRIAMRVAKDDDKLREQFGVTRDQASVLLSLLLGFTLALAVSRYDTRWKDVVDEANAIDTAQLRATFLDEPARADSTRLYKDYIASRVELGNAGLDEAARERARRKSKDIQQQLWVHANALAQERPTPITALYVQSVNETMDADDRRVAGIENRIPRSIWVMLGVLAIVASLMAGASVRKRSLTVMLVPAVTFAIVTLLIADLDTPGKGLIQVDTRALMRLQ